MSDDSAPNDPGSKKMPEGMRVVRKRRKKRKDSRQTLFLKKREILRDMHDDTGAVGLKEQVERLKSAKKANEQGKPLEENWGGSKKGRRGLRWVLLMLFALAIPILAIITGFQLIKSEQGATRTRVDTSLNFDQTETVVLPYDPTGPIAWFTEHPAEAYAGAVELLDSLNETGSGLPARGLLRDEVRTYEKIKAGSLGWEAEFVTSDPRDLFWSTGTIGETGYIVLEGRHRNYDKFRSYFVKTPEGLRLDWDATVAWSEMPIKDLVAAAPRHPVLVRCVLLKEANYDTSQHPASLYSWYLVRSPNDPSHVWAQVPAGGELDLKLRNMFRFGWIVLDRHPEMRATIRLRKPQLGFRSNEFEIEDLVAEDWVLD